MTKTQLKDSLFWIREAAKKNVFFWDIFPKSVYSPTHPRVFVRFGKTKGEIWVEKGDIRGNLGGFVGFGPCLGISHPTHPHLGKISQKNVFFIPSLKRLWSLWNLRHVVAGSDYKREPSLEEDFLWRCSHIGAVGHHCSTLCLQVKISTHCCSWRCWTVDFLS